jgi:hypothetical protein
MPPVLDARVDGGAPQDSEIKHQFSTFINIKWITEVIFCVQAFLFPHIFQKQRVLNDL